MLMTFMTLPPDPDPVFRRPDAENIWRYTRAAEQYARSTDKADTSSSANDARQAALDLAKTVKDAEGAASWIEIAEVWAKRANDQGRVLNLVGP